MPENLTVSTTATLSGKSITSNVEVISDGFVRKTPTVASAKTGQITTRTDADTCVVTLDAGHGLVTGDDVTIFWSGGYRTGMAATVTGNALGLDAGTGIDLPPNLSAVTVSKANPEVFILDLSTSTAIIISTGGQVTASGVAKFYNSANALVGSVIYMDNGSYIWTGAGAPAANAPVASVKLYHSYGLGSLNMTVAAMFN